MRIRSLFCIVLALLFVPAALADRVVDYDDVEYNNTDSGFIEVYTKDGKTVRIVSKEFIYYYERVIGAEVYSAYWLGNIDCVSEYYVDRLSYSGAHILQVGDEMRSCLEYAGGYVRDVRIVSDTCTRIADYAFQACESYDNYQNGIRSVVLPCNLESIGKEAFAGQTGLKRIYIPKTVTSMGSDCIPTQTTIVCHKNSYAARWARQYGRNYETIEDGLNLGKGIFTLPDELKSVEYGAFEDVPIKYVMLKDLDAYYTSNLDPDIIYLYDDPNDPEIPYFTRSNPVNLAFTCDLD